MRKRGISAVVPAVLIAVMTIAECFCSSVPTHAKEDNTDLQSNIASTGSTSLDNTQRKEVILEQDDKQNDEPADQPIKESNQTDLPKELPKLVEVDPFPVEEYEEVEEATKEPPRCRVTFRILDSSEGEIDSSTAYSTEGNSYIAEIQLNDAIEEGTNTQFTSSISDSGNKINGITLQNSIAASLLRYPTAEEFGKGFAFDPATQYIAWYVIDATYSNDIYVDGVIRKRSIPIEKDNVDEKVEEKDQPVKADPEIIPNGPVPDVTINIETACNTPAFEYDGKDHYIGGFNITVKDNNSATNYVTSFFDALGNLLKQEVHAGENGSGTYFEHNGIRYWVNIDAAYVVAKQIATYKIPFIFDNKEIAPEDIVVKVVDDAGNVISSIPSSRITKKAPSSDQLKVTSRKITIEAGTTVQNYSGQTITNKNVEITSGSLLKGHSLVDVVINGSQSGIGSSVNEITSYRIVDEYGNDVTKYYNVECVNGRLVLVDGHNSKKSGNSGDDNAPVTTGIKEKALPKKAVIIGGKAMEKTSSENNKILGVSRIARMSKTFDESNINLRLLIILLATGTAIYLSQIKVKE